VLKNRGRNEPVLPRDAIRPQPPQRRPLYGPKAVGSFVPGLTRQAFEKFGFSAATLLTDWATIVGADLAAYTAPERLKWPRAVEIGEDPAEESSKGRPGAMLILAVDPARALDVQYKVRQLVDRINAYFGYRAVADLRIVQTPLKRPITTSRLDTTSLLRHDRVVPKVEGVTDAGLKAALERMAAGLSEREAQRAAD
jgi:hypothetical protein